MRSPSQEEVAAGSAGNPSQCPGLPLQNLLLAACAIALVVGIAEASNAQTGFPFGHRVFGGDIASVVSRLSSVMLPAVCVIALLGGRGVAKLLLLPRRHSRRYGYWLLLWNAVLGTLPMVSLDLFATRTAGLWRWQSSAWQWQGITFSSLAGWLMINMLALLLATPALIDKRPVQPPPTLLSLAAWCALNLALLAACVSRASDAAVAVLAAPVALGTVVAFQRHRSAVANCGGQAGQE